MKKVIKNIIPVSLYNFLRDFYKKTPLYLAFLHPALFFKSIKNNVLGKTICFYPERPRECYMISKVCFVLGYGRTNDLKRKHVMTINWEDVTVRRAFSSLSNLQTKEKVVNLSCRDISKKRVNECFRVVFGYSLEVDPITFQGECLRKSDRNATHDGQIIRCPISTKEPGYVYQKLIDNRISVDLVQNLRLPIFNKSCPFVYIKHKPIKERFATMNHRVYVFPLDTVVNLSERNNIFRFCNEIGLDYGELDVLRDKDGKLYIIDVNNTPVGPPNKLSFGLRIKVFKMLADSFNQFTDEFVKNYE